jgi:hypothetical protein
MRISTIQVSSVMLRSKKLEIRKQMWKLKDPSDENQTECHEIEPNSSKDRAMPEEDNPKYRCNFAEQNITICYKACREWRSYVTKNSLLHSVACYLPLIVTCHVYQR